MKVLFIVPYPSEGPSNRFRVEQYLSYLRQKGWSYSLRPFYNSYLYRILYKKGRYLHKILLVFFFALRRLRDVCLARHYDAVFIHREASPFPGDFFETMFRKFSRRLIYDFDDSVFQKKPLKTEKIIAVADTVIAGNSFLAAYAARLNKNVVILPTCIDTDIYKPRGSSVRRDKIVVGWIGTSFTSIYLEMLSGVYAQLQRKFSHRLEFRVVGADYKMPGAAVICRGWSLESEVAELQDFDIGVMPLFDDDWAKGKCAFKIIQYMAVGIPTAASRVGMNIEVIEEGADGFLPVSPKEWVEKLSLLIEDAHLRQRMGEAARRKAQNLYSVSVNKDTFLKIIEGAA
jgi:glycosyltransferase involved in cell wall biosynthesis